ncbi:MAG: hypothetical protein AXA67_12100 [Methylothermaceae bacteria B42]|nr:MAG: hypothetical protein AXA67_12100 [Methylothermaceae bacteria B42]HHJ39272.1 DNA recombination protein RmuC [Methylothermaceae bacterium]
MRMTLDPQWWVWIALAAGLLAGGLLVFFFHKRQTRHQIALAQANHDKELALLRQRLEQVTGDNHRLQDSVDLLKQENTDLKNCLGQAENTLSRLETRLQERDQKIQEQQQDIARRDQRIESLEQQRHTLNAEVAEMKTRLAEQQRHNEEKLAELDKARAQLKTEFENLAHRIFEEKGRQFSEQNRKGLDELLSPVRTQLQDFRKRIDEIHTEEQRGRGSLQEHLRQLQEMNQRLNEEARNLTLALKGDKKAQGTWGEIVLETVLERSGLRKGQEYEVQGSFRDDEGKRLQPDVIIHLPEGKDIIIDSKVSLNAYQSYVAANDESEAKAALKSHLLAIRNHITSLSGKNYEHLQGVNSLDFVLMFMPIEPAFTTAFQEDPQLFSWAFERKIIVVTPTTLLATLRTIENMWRFERQNENTRKIAERAGRLYDKLRGFLEDFEKIGQQLDTVHGSYQTARQKLVEGRGNLIRQAEQFVELGIKVKKTLPQTLREEAGTDESLNMLADDDERDNSVP